MHLFCWRNSSDMFEHIIREWKSSNATPNLIALFHLMYSGLPSRNVFGWNITWSTSREMAVRLVFLLPNVKIWTIMVHGNATTTTRFSCVHIDQKLSICFLFFFISFFSFWFLVYDLLKQVKKKTNKQILVELFWNYHKMGSSLTMTSRMTVRIKSSPTRLATRSALLMFYADAVLGRVNVIVKGFRAIETDTADATETFITETHLLFFLSSCLKTLSARTAASFLDSQWTRGGESGLGFRRRIG